MWPAKPAEVSALETFRPIDAKSTADFRLPSGGDLRAPIIQKENYHTTHQYRIEA